MNNKKAYTWGFWGLLLIAFLRLLLLLFFYFTIRNLSASIVKAPSIQIFTAFEIALVIIVVAEAIVYWVLRYRIEKKQWVRLHFWSLLIAMVIMPIALSISMMVFQYNLDRTQSASSVIFFNKIRFLLSWIFTVTGHGFFVLTVIISIGKKNEPAVNEESDGILEEFANEN